MGVDHDSGTGRVDFVRYMVCCLFFYQVVFFALLCFYVFGIWDTGQLLS